MLKELSTQDPQSLQYRRMRSDLVKTYKIINNIDKVDSNTVFPRNESCTRGHKHKIYKKHSRTNIRKYSFYQRDHFTF